MDSNSDNRQDQLSKRSDLWTQTLITDRISFLRDQTMDSNSDNRQDQTPQRSDHGLKL